MPFSHNVVLTVDDASIALNVADDDADDDADAVAYADDVEIQKCYLT